MTIKEASKEVMEDSEIGEKYREWTKRMVENDHNANRKRGK